MFLIGLALAIGIIAGVFLVVRYTSNPEQIEEHADDFARAEVQEQDSVLGKALLNLGRRVSGLPYVDLNEESPGYKALRYKIAASGGLYANSVNVFLSVQVAAFIISACVIALAMFSGTSGLVLFALLAVGLIIAYYPYQRLTSTAKKRFLQVNQALPEFAELLLMPLSSGYGILPSLSFTAERVNNLVGQEVSMMLQMVASRSMSEEKAFAEAGARLGTPAAIAFFNTLSQAYMQGTEATSLLRGQAVQLRKLAYEDTRAKLKTLPNRLVIVIGLCLMIPLFIITLFPVISQLSSSLSGA